MLKKEKGDSEVATINIRKMLISVPGALVNNTQYSKITLEFVQSMFVKYKRYYFQCKNYLFVSLTSAPEALVNMTLSIILGHKRKEKSDS
jgi:hypothetical protein